MKLSSFRYEKKDTIVHRLDPRVKIILIAGLSSVLILADFYLLILVGALILFTGIIGRIDILRCLWETKPFLVLIGFIFLVHSFATSGDPILTLWKLNLTIEGLIYGSKIVFRLLFIVILGFLYSASTSPEKTRSAVEWFLSPLPLNEKVLGTSASIGTRFFPVVVEDAKKIQEAQKARYVEGAGSLKRLKSIVISILTRTFRHAEKISLAMDAKCYSIDVASPIRLDSKVRDYVILITIMSFVVIMHLYMVIY